MAKLILTAENFAFGPIGKLLNVADLLKEQGHEMEFAGFGTSLQLAKHFPFSAVHEVDTDNKASIPALEAIVAKGDMLISSMDLASIIVAKRLGKPAVWIDCLFWFWDSIPEPLFDIDLYIREKSMDDSVNDAKYSSKIKNLYNVGPIIGRVKDTKRKRQALVSYGGGEASYWYKAGSDTNYPFVMTNILLNSVNWIQFDEIIIATNERIATELARRFPQVPFEFVFLPYGRFLLELAQSEVALITPGLVTAETVFELGTPTIFLPPSNNSQYIQLDEFNERGLALASVHLSDFMDKLDLRGKPLHESIQEVLKQLRELERSTEIQSKIGESINELVKTREKWSRESVSRGIKFINSLGGNGAQTAADKITQLTTEM